MGNERLPFLHNLIKHLYNSIQEFIFLLIFHSLLKDFLHMNMQKINYIFM